MNSLSIDQAKVIIEEYLKVVETNINMALTIVDSQTKEKSNFYVFSYNTKEFLQSGNFSSALAGNSPLFIDKSNGKIYESGTSHSTEYYMDKFEKGEMEEFSEVTVKSL